MECLASEDVLGIHAELTKLFENENDPISPPGVRDMNLLHSAVHRQFTGFEGQEKYTDARDNAATLLYGLCMDHPFHNGNKRTALVSTLIHLDKNHYIPTQVSHDDFYNLVVSLAKHDLHVTCPSESRTITRRSRASKQPLSPDEEVSVLGCWLRSKTRVTQKGERPLTFRKLRQILPRFECYLGDPHKNFIDIYKQEKVTKKFLGIVISEAHKPVKKTQLAYPGEGAVLPPASLRMLRRECGLNLEEGIDSETFYDGEERIDFILNHYRGLLKRLARI